MTTTTQQNDLPLFADQVKPDPNVSYLVGLLESRDWMTAREIIELVQRQTGVRWPDRKVRELAAASKGQIASGQNGYKLVRAMTKEEFDHFQNWMKSQADEMVRRVLEASKVFYQHKAI